MSTKRCGLFHSLALAAVVCVLPLARAGADTDPFAGTHTVTTAYDDNLGDGLSLSYEDTSVTIATSDLVTYMLSPPGMTMARTGNQLTLDPRPQMTDPSHAALNCYALSNGTIGAFAYLGQDVPPPSDLGVRVGTWGTGAVVTAAQIAGLWQGTLLYDDDLTEDPSAPFTVFNSTFTVTDLGGSHIQLDFGGGMTVAATISGNVIVATDPNFDYFRMITDGTTFVAAAMNEEEVAVGALGNISAGIAMATLIPEPATAGLLALGAAALLLRRRRR